MQDTATEFMVNTAGQLQPVAWRRRFRSTSGTSASKKHQGKALIDLLDGLFARFAADRKQQERFGDFVIRTGVVQPVVAPEEDYHEGA